MKRVICVSLLALTALTVYGCSPQEKAGISPLPQNRPANWEIRPYGDLRS